VIPAAVLAATVSLALLSIASGAWWLHRHLVVVTVQGTSMEPTLRHGERVLVRRASITAIRTGQVVVVAPGKPAGPLSPDYSMWMIKRLLAAPGDPVPRREVPILDSVPETTVPPGQMVVIGDNPASGDSRQLGYFYTANLLGVVVRRLGTTGSQVPRRSAAETVRATGQDSAR
jgi:signal peptidase I